MPDCLSSDVSDNSNLISSVTISVPAMNQFRWQNVFFFVDPELLSSVDSETENAIQLQSVLDSKYLLKREA